MGLVINPIGFRIGYSKTWTDAWYLHRINYPVFVHNSLAIKSLVFFILFRYFPSRFSKWLYSHLNFYFSNNKFFINIFIYDSHSPYLYYRLVKRHKRRWFKRVRLKRYWTKKYLLNEQWIYQRWMLLLQYLGIKFENLKLDDINYRLTKRQLRKISYLKTKYGSDWVAKEELQVWMYPIYATYYDGYSKLGFPVLNKLFKTFIYPRIKKSKKKKSYNHEEYSSADVILKSYKYLYFLFSFVDKIFRFSPSYPRSPFNRFVLKFVFRFFFIWFIYKPYLMQLAKMIEWIVSYLNIDSKIRIYLLDNHHLSASFISRYILMALRMKFDYRDTLIPIRKSLSRQMYIKRWIHARDVKKFGWSIYYDRYIKLKSDRFFYFKSLFNFSKLYLFRHIKSLILKKRVFLTNLRKKYFFHLNLKLNLNKLFKNFSFNPYKSFFFYFKKIKLKHLKSIRKQCFRKFLEITWTNVNIYWKKYLLNFVEYFFFHGYFFFYNVFIINLNLKEHNYLKIHFLNNIILLNKNIKKKILFKNRLKKKFKFIGNFFFHYCQYSKNFVSFPFNRLNYNNYIKNLYNYELLEIKKKRKNLNNDLEMIPLNSKLKRIEILDNHKAFLYGYKFHFVGRFTRKQKAASLWFLKGSNSVSSYYANIDYGFFTNTMRYSACSLKVWLYKSKITPIRGFRFI